MSKFELVKYKCHKVVEAGKIMSMVQDLENEKLILNLYEGLNTVILPTKLSYLRRHNPQTGGYYVRYDNGYESYSPAETFENGYTRIMDEGEIQQSEYAVAVPLATLQHWLGLLELDNPSDLTLGLNEYLDKGRRVSATWHMPEYGPTTCNFGGALHMLTRMGKCVARQGWNGKGQYVVMMHVQKVVTDHLPNLVSEINPCLALFNTQGELQPGWVPSMGDLLADDWIAITDE
jgi:hypothetical protein